MGPNTLSSYHAALEARYFIIPDGRCEVTGQTGSGNHIKVLNHGLHFRVEIRGGFPSINLHDQGKAGSTIFRIWDGLGFPPTGDGMNCDQVAARQVGCPAPHEFIDVQRTDITSVTAKNPFVVFLKDRFVRLVGRLADTRKEGGLALIRPVQFEAQICDAYRNFRTPCRFRTDSVR